MTTIKISTAGNWIDTLAPLANLALKRHSPLNGYGRAKNTSCHGSGFTLIELMVVMLLISIVLAVAIPRFEGGPLQDSEKKLSRWLINAARMSRSAAIQKQRVQVLSVDVDNQRIWMAHVDMSEDELNSAADKAFTIDPSMQIVKVQFPNLEPVTSGTAEIRFHPAGYSDRVLIQIETSDAERISYLLEPLMPKIKILDEWIDL